MMKHVLLPEKFMAIQPTPPRATYSHQKSGFNKALLRETNG